MVQKTYNFHTPIGSVGTLYDMTPHAVDARLNGEEDSTALKYGMGVVRGATPGRDIVLPDDTSEADAFEGIVLNGGTKELTMTGENLIHNKQTVDVLRYGRAWVLLPDDIEPAYGEQVYLIIDGDDAGKFSNDDTDAIEIPAMFITGNGTGSTAAVHLYDQKAQ